MERRSKSTFSRSIFFLCLFVCSSLFCPGISLSMDYATNSVGVRNSIKITDMSGSLSSTGASITVSAWDVNGNALTESGSATSLKLYSHGTTTITGTDLAARFSGATPMTYQYAVGSSMYIITNVKSSTDGTLNVPSGYTSGTTNFVANSLGPRNTIKITDMSGTISASGAAITISAWDVNGSTIPETGTASSLKLYSHGTTMISGTDLMARFPSATPMSYEFTVASTKYVITNVKNSSDGSINIPYAYTNGTTNFVDNSIGARNTIKITDMSGTISSSGAAITVSAWDVSGNALTESGTAASFTLYSHGTTTISGTDLAARFPGATPMAYEFAVNSSRYVITNIKSSADGSINIPYIYTNGTTGYATNSISSLNTIKISDTSGTLSPAGCAITVSAWDFNGNSIAESGSATSLKLYSHGTTTITGTDLAARFPGATPMAYEFDVESTNYIITNITSDVSRTINIPNVYTHAAAGVSDPPSAVSVTNTGTQTVGSRSFSSSTQLAVAWIAPVDSVDHYEITATESIKQTAVTATSSVTAVTLTGLKAATPYSVIVKACQDAACTTSASAAAVSGTTSAEYWQLQGTGNSYTTMTKAVSDGSVLSWVMRWGAEAGSLAYRFQYYYKTTVQGRDGVAIATTAGTNASVATLTSFATDTSLGLRNPCTPPNYTDCASTAAALEINALQAIPLAASNTVRLYLEATALKETNRPTRIYYIDARDGLVGQKFTTGTSKTYCGGAGSSDYAPGGDCEFTPVIGVAGDSQMPSPLYQARQFKIGYPKLNSWMWDGAAGTFMVITGDDACAEHVNALFYAVYDGSTWNVATDGAGCAKPLHNAGHGPVLLHLGAAKYKLYFEDAANGQSGKPLHLLYADGASSGGASVDFEDWEASSSAREVNFLWPDGSLLDAQDESGLGDHMIPPSDSLANQFMFVNLGGMDNDKWKAGSAGLGLAVLLNP